jgi:hypothetical protein
VNIGQISQLLLADASLLAECSDSFAQVHEDTTSDWRVQEELG